VGAAPSGSYKFEVTGTSKVSGVLTLGSTLSNGTYTYTLPAATGTLALVGGAGVGTVTSVAALTLGTTGTDLSSTVANSTTTPVITLNVPTASATNRGALSSADWTTFNNKQGTITLTTTGTSGVATLIANTLNIPNYGSALSGYLPLTGGTLTGALGGTSASFSSTITATNTVTISSTTNAGLVAATNSTTGYTFIDIINNGASGKNYQIGLGGNGAASGYANNLYFDLVGVGNVMTLTSGRNVGIGTTSPANKLTISNNGNAAIAFRINDTNANNSTLAINVSNSDAAIVVSGTSGIPFDIYNGGAIRLSIASTGAATFSSSVTANATSGGTTMILNGRNNTGVDDNIVSFYKFDGTTLQGRIYARSNILGFRDATNTDVLNIVAGNVGIGTSSPTDTLHLERSGTTVYNSSRYTNPNSTANFYVGVGGSGVANGSLQNNAYIYNAGNSATIFATNDSERMRITSGGNVGIGTNNPAEKLQLTNSAGAGVFIRFTDTGGDGVYIGARNNVIELYAGGAEAMRITSGRNVLIGTSTDATGKLQVNGTIYATGFYESSDIRFKNILETNPNVNVLGIDVIKFTRKDNDTNQVRYGYSAQQVQSILPDAVTGNDFLNVNYLDVHTLKIAALEQEIKELKAKMN
jgi:hypothetical protein